MDILDEVDVLRRDAEPFVDDPEESSAVLIT
jgi:hypothetical protein